MYKLYSSSGSAAMAPHVILNEIGEPFELIKIDDEKREQKGAAYLRLNPHGRVPTLIYDGGKVMYESAAICLFLTERHPEVKLAPLPGHADRGLFLQWMAYLTNTPQECLMHYWHPYYFIDGADRQAECAKKAEIRSDEMFSFLDGQLKQSGPYLCGKTFYACDIYLAMLARWTRKMPKPAVTHPEISRLVRDCLARPSYRKMLEDTEIEQTA
jgi:glutathione S-transferase